MSFTRPILAHDRTIITAIVLICGTFLLWRFGESTPIVALVSSMWTLALTFWFRANPNPDDRDR
jgi:thiol:disulfide interchange protein